MKYYNRGPVFTNKEINWLLSAAYWHGHENRFKPKETLKTFDMTEEDLDIIAYKLYKMKPSDEEYKNV